MKMMSLSFKWICFLAFFKISETLSCFLPKGKSSGACKILYQYVTSREEWGATEPTSVIDCIPRPAEYVIIHHTVSYPCSTGSSCKKSMKQLQKEHQAAKEWFDVGYHFVIGGDNKAYEGRPFHKAGAHTKYHNRNSIGIALLGDFEKDCPSVEMLDLIPKIVFCALEKGYLADNFKVIGHRDAYCTSCPGEALYAVIKAWPRFPKTVPIPSYTCDVKNVTVPETTTIPETPEPTTELPMMTTEMVTTTAAPTTTKMPTTASSTEKTIAIPLYYYLIFSKVPFPCCSNGSKDAGGKGGVLVPLSGIVAAI